MQASKLQRNQWHDRTGTNMVRLGHMYGSPRGWHARSLQSANLNEIQDLNIQHNIRAAAIFPRGVNVKQLVRDTPWCLFVNWPPRNWTILIASPVDAEAWIESAYNLGAIAWYIDDAAPVFVYTPIQHPDPFTDLQDPDFDPDSIDTVSRRDFGPGNINHDIVRQDLKNGYLTVVQIAAKHGVSRTMIYNIKDMLTGKKEYKPPVYSKYDEDAVVLDIKSQMYNRLEICQKYEITLAQLTHLQKKRNLRGYFRKGVRVGSKVPKLRK